MFRDGDADVSRAKLIARMERFIADVVGHFRGRVFAWDVVNEAIVYDEPEHATDANGYRLALAQHHRPEFIEIAFRAAAKMTRTRCSSATTTRPRTPKAAAILQLVKDLKARGVKIDGVGRRCIAPASSLRWPRWNLDRRTGHDWRDPARDRAGLRHQ